MTFSFEKERLTAISTDGSTMGYISFPQIRKDLVNISQIVTAPGFRHLGVADRMMEALLTHLTEQNQKAALSSPYAQQYVSRNTQWKHILPGAIPCVTH